MNGVVVKFGMGASGDTATKEVVVTLNTTLQRVNIDLTGLNQSSINGLWYMCVESSSNASIPSPMTFYVDEVSYDELPPNTPYSDYAVSADASFTKGETFVYPNPAKEGKNPTIHVEVGVADKLQINIYDVSGELVGNTEITDSPSIVDGKYAYEFEWNVSGKPSGVYIARIIANKDTNNIKITKKFAVIK